MRPTRRTQPYRKSKPRQPGGALSAMLRGSAAHSANPQDVQRRTAKMARKRRRKRQGGLSAAIRGY